MAPRKKVNDFESSLKKAGSTIGQLVAKSQAKIEKTRRQAIEKTGKLFASISQKAEHTIESTIEKIHEETAPANENNRPDTQPSFKPIKNKAIRESVLFLAEDILEYLTDNGKTPINELLMIMGKRRRNPGMTFGAIGWLIGENRIHITRNGENISLK